MDQSMSRFHQCLENNNWEHRAPVGSRPISECGVHRHAPKWVVVLVESRADNLPSAEIGGQRSQHGVLWVRKSRVLPLESQQHVARRALAMLGDNDLRLAPQVVTLVVLINVIILWPVHEEHHVGVLLYGSRLPKVAQLGAFALQPLSVFHRSVQLRESEDGYVQFLGQAFERARYR